jgi:hypothetical protein
MTSLSRALSSEIDRVARYLTDHRLEPPRASCLHQFRQEILDHPDEVLDALDEALQRHALQPIALRAACRGDLEPFPGSAYRAFAVESTTPEGIEPVYLAIGPYYDGIIRCQAKRGLDNAQLSSR